MKSSPRFISVQLLLLLSVFIGCSKKSGYNEYIPEQLKQYSVFQEGSYWVYKNESTGMIDSSYLLKPPVYLYNDPVNDPPQNRYETCDIYFGGTFLLHSTTSTSDYLMSFKNASGSVCLYNNFQPGYTLDNDYYHSFMNLNYFDSLIINNKTFYHVMNTQYKSWNHQGDTTTYTYYLAKSIGLIKFTLDKNHQDTSWSILRYHVIL
ncbi:MAG: hypothetical protein NT040_11020 [Bacteroidetes bacterium]|nr:hypothetical protein [Bacteroidota bacterium]